MDPNKKKIEEKGPGNEMSDAYGKSSVNGLDAVIPGLRGAPALRLKNTQSYDDEAASTIQHPLHGKLTSIQQSMSEVATAISSVQSSSEKLFSLRGQLNQMRESAEKNTGENFSKERVAELLKELNQVDGKINDLVGDIKNIPNLPVDIPALDVSAKDINLQGDPDKMLNKIKEELKKIGDSEWFLLGVKKKLNKTTTNMQYELSEIMKVGDSMIEQNMSLELGVFSLSRNLEEAYKAMRGQANIEPEVAVQLLNNPEENIVEGAVVE